MSNVLNNGKYWFVASKDGDIVLPMPGDLIVVDGDNAHLVLDSEYEYGLDHIKLEAIVTDKERMALAPRNGEKFSAMKTKRLLLSDYKKDQYMLFRGFVKIFPINYKFKIINLFTKGLFDSKKVINKLHLLIGAMFSKGLFNSKKVINKLHLFINDVMENIKNIVKNKKK